MNQSFIQCNSYQKWSVRFMKCDGASNHCIPMGSRSCNGLCQYCFHIMTLMAGYYIDIISSCYSTAGKSFKCSTCYINKDFPISMRCK